ncbi:DegV family protein [Chloroflexota bacterium]
MQKVAIVADSIAYLTPETVSRSHLRVIPINIYFDGRIYQDGVDIISAEAYQLLDKAPAHFASSSASVGEHIDTYREASAHADVPERGERLKKRISSKFDCAELRISEFNPIMGYSCGTGTIGIAFYNVD